MNSYAAKICNLAELLRRGGGGGPTTKKIMPPAKSQDVLCLFCWIPPPFVVVLRRVSLVRVSYGTRKVGKGKLGKS